MALGVSLCAQDAESPSSPPSPSLLERLRESRVDCHTVAVRFTQIKRLHLLDVTLTAQGWMFFRRPDSLRYEMVSPVRSLLLYDENKVSHYTFSEGQWRRLRSPGADAVGRVLRQIGHWIQGDFTADGKVFAMEVLPWEQGAGIFRLTPSSPVLREYVQQISLYVEKAPDYRVTRVVIQESEQDTTELRFTQERHNGDLPEKTFTSPEASASCGAVFDQPEPNCPDPNHPEKSSV
jgi:outer membrane lipoprotein-sorting protein